MTNERLGVSSADLDDIDLPRLDAFLQERAPSLMATSTRDEVAIRLGLLTKVAPRVLPTITGLYVFGKLPQLHFPEWGVGCMASSGTTLLDPVAARADLEGPLPDLVEACASFVRSRAGTEGQPASDPTARSGGFGVGGPTPYDPLRGATPPTLDAGEYPDSILREVIVNALVHRDLRKPSRVALRLFMDRLEVWSPGGPPEGTSDLEELGREGGVSHPKNPILASVARSLGLGEQLGRGLHVVLQRGAGSGSEARVEIRSSPRDVLVVLPSRWRRPRAARELI